MHYLLYRGPIKLLEPLVLLGSKSLLFKNLHFCGVKTQTFCFPTRAPMALSSFTKNLISILSSTSSEPLARRLALSKAITLIESSSPPRQTQAQLLLANLPPRTRSPSARNWRSNPFRIGIAGPPGAGKSTLIETFGMFLLDSSSDKDKNDLPNNLAVICVDPSSIFTGGSILGDKTRMQHLSNHPRAYVRPSPTSLALGGLGCYTYDVVSLTESAQYDFTIVETVGLGQSELEVDQVVDCLILVVPPGGGDELQGVKKGIVEVADIVVVNKADGGFLEQAKRTAGDYKSGVMYQMRKIVDWHPPVLLVSGQSGAGVDKLFDTICEFREKNAKAVEQKREDQGRFWMYKMFEDLVRRELKTNEGIVEKRLELEKIVGKSITARFAATELLEKMFIR